MTMERRELNIRHSPLCGAVCAMIAVLLCLTAILSVGTAYSRYSKTITGTMGYAVGSKSRVWVMGQRDANQMGSALPETWTPIDSVTYNRSVSLCVSNSNETKSVISNETMKIRLWLYLPESVYNDGCVLTLQVDGESQIYTATGDYLTSSTAASKELNETGWVYTFYDSSGNELIRTLKGGRVSDLNLTLTATETTSELNGYRILVDIIQEDTTLLSANA